MNRDTKKRLSIPAPSSEKPLTEIIPLKKTDLTVYTSPKLEPIGYGP